MLIKIIASKSMKLVWCLGLLVMLWYPAQAVTIRVAHWETDPLYTDASRMKTIDQAVQEMVEPYGINVEVVISSPQGYREQVMIQTMAGMGPDVIMESSHWVGQLVEAGLLKDLTPFLKDDEELGFDSYIPQTWEFNTIGGGTWLLPVGGSPFLMFYNKDHFRQAGMSFPDETWHWQEEVYDVVRKLRQVDSFGLVSRYGLLLENRLLTPIFSNGGDILNDGHSQCLIDQDEVIDILELFQEWRINDLIPASANHRPSFSREVGSMHGVMGTFGIEIYQQNSNLDYGLTYVPKGKAGRSIEGFTNGWAINADTQHPAEAWIVAKAYVQVSADRDDALSWIQGKVDGDRLSRMQQEWELSYSEVEIVLDSLQYMRPVFRGSIPANYERIRSIVDEALVDVVWKGKEAYSTLSEASRKVNNLLQ